MKGKQNKKHCVPTDEPYVENINLVTGDKFNYDRPLLTERQINELCINQNQSHIDKFMRILIDGQKIQKWSIFENMAYYLKSNKQILIVLETINKNYTQYWQFLSIIGDGFSTFLDRPPKDLTTESIGLIFQISYRTLTQNPIQVQDWGKVFEKIVKYPNLKTERCQEYINGSFAMNSPPERRRVAFCMINHLINYSKQVKKTGISKVLFFNKDQNAKSRYEICCIMKKMLRQNPKQDQVWKAIWQYFDDKDSSVKQLALNILCSILYRPNFQNILQSLAQEKYESDFSKSIGTFIITYHQIIQQSQRAKIQIIAFFNRIFKSKKIQNISSLLSNLTRATMNVLGEGKIYEDLNFSLLSTKNKLVVQSLIKFCFEVEDIQFRDAIRNIIFKGLKQLQYEVWENTFQLSQIFDLTQEDEAAIYLSVCNKMLESSKWNCISKMLSIFPKMTIGQILYEKFCLFLLKLWMMCPIFLQHKIIECVIYLVLINRRSLQLLITIRQKILNSKFWNHRRNYILFYATIKSCTSFQIHKLVPTLIYKNIVADKCFGVRFTLLEYAPQIYKFTDPSQITQKNMIKQAVAKLEEEKDIEMKEKAKMTKNQIDKIDRNSTWLQQLYDRSRQLVEKQSKMIQTNNCDQKRTIKTQHQIIKSTAKNKTRLSIEQRRTVNLSKGVHKQGMNKQISIDSITNITQKQTTTLLPKKNNLFRCHSVKIKGPPKKI